MNEIDELNNNYPDIINIFGFDYISAARAYQAAKYLLFTYTRGIIESKAAKLIRLNFNIDKKKYHANEGWISCRDNVLRYILYTRYANNKRLSDILYSRNVRNLFLIETKGVLDNQYLPPTPIDHSYWHIPYYLLSTTRSNLNQENIDKLIMNEFNAIINLDDIIPVNAKSHFGFKYVKTEIDEFSYKTFYLPNLDEDNTFRMAILIIKMIGVGQQILICGNDYKKSVLIGVVLGLLYHLDGEQVVKMVQRQLDVSLDHLTISIISDILEDYYYYPGIWMI